jgi:nitroreductase
MNPKDCSPVDDNLRPSAGQAEFFLRSRRSVRVYKDKPVSRQTIARLIDIARYAPSGHNNQLVEWLVIHDKKDVQKYASMAIDWVKFVIREFPEIAAGYHMDLIIKAWEEGADRICRNAPHIIISHGPEQNMMIQSTCTIAMTYLELAASSQKLGACWAGYFNRAAADWPPLKKALGLPEGHTVFGAVMLGHPKYKYHRIPLRKKAKITWK